MLLSSTLSDFKKANKFKKIPLLHSMPELDSYRFSNEKSWFLGRMSTQSIVMKNIFDVIEKMSKTTCNVLLRGESGTGKELAAMTIHELSNRSNHSFVAINCSAIPENLLESELFGHKKGSFTGAIEARKGLFEEANGGTIFLDEIGDMSFALQAKLLRVIQEREITPVGENRPKKIDVRIISATHHDLSELALKGSFRQDLYYRLAVVPIVLPALRERLVDIPMLADRFLEKYCERNQVIKKMFNEAAMQKLISMDWLGNIRELENTVERAVALSTNVMIDVSELDLKHTNLNGPQTHLTFESLKTLKEIEKAYILYVLQHTHQQKDQASKILGIDRKTLYRKKRIFSAEASCVV